MTVVDGRVSRSSIGSPTVTATVGPDGSFETTMQYMGPVRPFVRMEGHISGEKLEADVEGSFCKFHYSLKRIY
jgi:hypothetical protein